MYNGPEHTRLLTYPPPRTHEALPWLSNTRLSLSTRGSPPGSNTWLPHPGATQGPWSTRGSRTNQSTRGSPPRIDPSSRGSLLFRAHEALLLSPRGSPRVSRGPNSQGQHGAPLFLEITGLRSSRGSPLLPCRSSSRGSTWLEQHRAPMEFTGLQEYTRLPRWQHEADMRTETITIYIAPRSSTPVRIE